MLDSTLTTLSNPNSRYWIADSLSNLGLWIPIVSGIPDSRVHDSEFQKQKFPGYWILQEKVPGLRIFYRPIGHFTVMDGSEVDGDLVLNVGFYPDYPVESKFQVLDCGFFVKLRIVDSNR